MTEAGGMIEIATGGGIVRGVVVSTSTTVVVTGGESVRGITAIVRGTTAIVRGIGIGIGTAGGGTKMRDSKIARRRLKSAIRTGKILPPRKVLSALFTEYSMSPLKPL